MNNRSDFLQIYYRLTADFEKKLTLPFYLISRVWFTIFASGEVLVRELLSQPEIHFSKKMGFY